MYIVLWEFEVSPEQVDEFCSVYSPDGEWAQLFARASGYHSTELLRSSESSTRYLTIDRWKSVEEFELFQHRFREPYARLDECCERLTLSERKIGSFTTVSKG